MTSRELTRRYAADRRRQLARQDLCLRCRLCWGPVPHCIACQLTRLRAEARKVRPAPGSEARP